MRRRPAIDQLPLAKIGKFYTLLSVSDCVPVFTDSSGRRRRYLRRAGIGVSIVLLAYLAVTIVGLFSGPDAPGIRWPDRVRAVSGVHHARGSGTGSGHGVSPR